MKPQGHVPAAAPLGAHEGADLDVPLITRIAAWLAAILVLLVLATLLVFHLYEKQYPHRTSEAAPVVTSADLPPAPRLQIAPRLDLQKVRTVEDAHLEGYAWIDRTKGIARIPIERAMTRWVELQNASTGASPATSMPATSGPAKASAASIAPAGITELHMRQHKAQEETHAP